MPESEKQTWPIWEGRDFKQIQVWRAPDGAVVLENPEGLRQVHFTAAQWERVTAHVAEPRCTCEEMGGDPLCPVHDGDLIAERDAKRIAEQS